MIHISCQEIFHWGRHSCLYSNVGINYNSLIFFTSLRPIVYSCCFSNMVFTKALLYWLWLCLKTATWRPPILGSIQPTALCGVSICIVLSFSVYVYRPPMVLKLFWEHKVYSFSVKPTASVRKTWRCGLKDRMGWLAVFLRNRSSAFLLVSMKSLLKRSTMPFTTNFSGSGYKNRSRQTDRMNTKPKVCCRKSSLESFAHICIACVKWGGHGYCGQQIVESRWCNTSSNTYSRWLIHTWTMSVGWFSSSLLRSHTKSW